MNKLISAIRSEPIRSILYPVLGIVAAALVAKGALTQFSADTIIAIIGAVLGVPVAAEIARQRTQPWPTLPGRKDTGSADRPAVAGD